MANIYIFSEPIQSGRTTILENWLPKVQGAAGFLTPDIYGQRKLYDIASGDYFDFEVDPGDCPDHTRIDDRAFDNNIYRHGRQLLLNAVNNWPRWLIVDEVGPLEINEDGGWEPALSELIKQHNDSDNECDLMLVIRDTLLNEAIQHYRLHAAIVLDRKFFGK